MVKMYLYIQNKIPYLGGSKVIGWTNRQTDSTEIITNPHTQWFTNDIKLIKVRTI